MLEPERLWGTVVGGLIGECLSSEIEGCSALLQLNARAEHTGGLIGLARDSAVADCAASGSAQTGLEGTGGLVGWCEAGSLERCRADFTFTAEYGAGEVGGLAGAVLGGTVISDGTAVGSIAVPGISQQIGGLVGMLRNGEVIRCHSGCELSLGDAEEVGGLIGGLYGGRVIASYATGNLTASKVQGASWRSIGGLVGSASASEGLAILMEDCFALGSITVEEPLYQFARAGSVVGYGNGPDGWLKNSYGLGGLRISGSTQNVGGLVGSEHATGVVNSYWNVETTGVTTSNGGPGAIPRTTDHMTFPFSEDTYVGWDFENVWEEGGDLHHNDGYPFHKWQTVRHSLSYAAGPGGTLQGQTSQVRIPGATANPVAAIPDHGMRFVQWSDGCGDNPRLDRNVQSDVAVTAMFSPITSQWILH
jgi:hypothetical protein